MADERLRFEAFVKDNATGALKQIRAQLSAIKVEPGMKAAVGWLSEFKKGSDEFLTAARGTSGVVNAMGIAGLTSAAGLAELVRQMKEMTDRQLAMRELGREIGMTTDQVNAFAHAGAIFGVSGDAMGRALDHLAGQMPEFRRNLGPLMHELGRWPELIKKLQNEGTADQLRDIFKFLGSPELMREPQLQKKLLEAFFGNGDEMEKLFQKGAQGFIKEWERMGKALNPISPDLTKAQEEFRKSMVDLNVALENFENKIGPKFLAMLTKIVDDFRIILDGPTKEEQTALDKKEEERRKAFQERQKERGDVQADKQRRGGAEDERKAIEEEHERRRRAIEEERARRQNPTAPDGSTDLRFMPMGYRRAGGLLHNAAYTDEASSVSSPALFELGRMIAEGTKAGVLAAFREMMAEREAEAGAGGAFSAASLGASGGGYGGGRRYGGGGTVSAKGFTGGTGKWWNSEHVTHAVNRLMKEAGLSREGAEGLVARWAGVEAAGGPTSRNPASGALGIGQWLGDRQRGFGPDFDSQISHAIDELNHSEKRAGNVLRQAKTAAEAARGASMFERAEGYNPRTGYDNFSGKSLAASRRIHQLYGDVGADYARSGPVASPRDPGSIGWNPWLYPNNGNNIVVDPFGNPRRAKGMPGEDTEKSREKPFAGTIRADLHIHGNTSKAIVRTTGPIEARLRRWPTMTEASDLA